MSVIRRWDKSKPPTGPFALNRDCPQAVGLVCWYPQGGPSGKNNSFDLAGKYHLSGTNSAATRGDAGQPALTFASASSNALSVSSLPVSTFPLTLAAWARPATAHNGSAFGLASASGASGFGRKLLYFHPDGTVRLYSQNDSSGSIFISATGGYTTGQWTHGAAVFASSTDYRIFRAGGNKTTSSSSNAFGTPTRVDMGDDNTGGNYFNGDIGECGIWNVALSDDLVARLYDPGTRFELWYPLRSRKWFTQGAGASGTSATTNANDTSSASGTTTVVGTLARTNAADTSSASGTTTLLGTSATTNAADTSSASGTVGGGVSGTSATTNANDTSSASGTTTVVGTSATTNAADTASASGTTTVTGTSATTNAADTATASGAAGTVTGTAAVTNADDTASASGVSGTPRTATGAGRSRRRRPHVVEIDGHDFVVGSAEEAEALLESARQEAEEVARKAVERASKVKNRPVRKVIADARKALAPPEIRAPGIEDYAAQVTQHIEALYADALRTIEIAALIAKREREDEDDEDVLLLMA